MCWWKYDFLRGTQPCFPPKCIKNTFLAINNDNNFIQSTFTPLEIHENLKPVFLSQQYYFFQSTDLKLPNFEKT